MEHIYLSGSEEVGRAATRMNHAAEEITRAVGNLTYALEVNQRFLDDWLLRFKDVIETIGSWDHAR